MSTLVESSEVLAVETSCTDHALTVILDDGRTVSVPLVWFSRLLTATPEQRKDWKPIGGGMGLHWESIDEDIPVASLLQPDESMPDWTRRRSGSTSTRSLLCLVANEGRRRRATGISFWRRSDVKTGYGTS
jgi:Protein of unknown function (DUF3532).